VQKLFYQGRLLVVIIVMAPVDVSVVMPGFSDSWGNKRNRD